MISFEVGIGMLSGGLLGYVYYDMTHYFLHHDQPSWVPLQQLKRHHMRHHYQDHHRGYGITSTFWDRIFGTMP
jgi:dihydroceramide fatty acyl 2-hydroxylase